MPHHEMWLRQDTPDGMAHRLTTGQLCRHYCQSEAMVLSLQVNHMPLQAVSNNDTSALLHLGQLAVGR